MAKTIRYNTKTSRPLRAFTDMEVKRESHKRLNKVRDLEMRLEMKNR